MKPIIEVITYQTQGDIQEASENSVLSSYRLKYQQLIKELLGATELKREQTTLKKEKNQHKINQSIAYTPIDQSNKYTNHIQHCLWILFISKTIFEDKIMSGLLHFPASILSDHGEQTEAFIQIIKQYQETLNNISHTYDVFYGGGTIRPPHQKDPFGSITNIQDEILYQKAMMQIEISMQQYCNKKPIQITGPKTGGNEMVYINNQQCKITILYPKDPPTSPHTDQQSTP